jgi:pyridinium-3,5-biscarboxylic acid mononucleotide sulfurtransferase
VVLIHGLTCERWFAAYLGQLCLIFRCAQPPGSELDKARGQWQGVSVLMDKYEELSELVRSFGSCLVAYSGGVDSVFLARVCRDVLGERSLAVIADSPSLPRRELTEALELASRYGIPVRVARTREFENAEYLANPVNRCYFCKFELFSELVPIARSEGLAVILYGENASDVGDVRPGAKAAADFAVRAPLKEVGLTKSEIRALSAELGLPTADKPQMACLSSRIPYGEAVTPKKLSMIEQAENFLRDRGYRDVRVRHHELSQGALARIELGPTEIPKLLENGEGGRIAVALREAGYLHVVLDLLGYRRGSTNEVIAPAERSVAAGG